MMDYPDLSHELHLCDEALQRAEDQVRRDAKVKRVLAETICRVDQRYENARLTVGAYREFIGACGMGEDYEQWAIQKALEGR